jgi:hypothetical protein
MLLFLLELNVKIITRKEAQEQGLTLYFTGLTCANGHISERWCCDKQCKECGKIKRKAHYARNAEKEKAARRSYYITNKENVAKQKKKNRKYHNSSDAVFHQKMRDELADNYIKEKLRQQFGLATHQITPDIITIKRHELQQHRIFKEINNGTN